jgi:predicted dehydrogenase
LIRNIAQRAKRPPLPNTFVDDGRDVFGGGVGTETFPTCDQYTIQGDVFSRAVRGDGEVPVSIEDAMGNVAVLEAVFRSAETGSWERPQESFKG